MSATTRPALPAVRRVGHQCLRGGAMSATLRPMSPTLSSIVSISTLVRMRLVRDTPTTQLSVQRLRGGLVTATPRQCIRIGSQQSVNACAEDQCRDRSHASY
jgi:hypothetical protein